MASSFEDDFAEGTLIQQDIAQIDALLSHCPELEEEELPTDQQMSTAIKAILEQDYSTFNFEDFHTVKPELLGQLYGRIRNHLTGLKEDRKAAFDALGVEPEPEP